LTNNLYLFHVNGPYWKEQVHQRFITQTFDDSHQFNDGSLSLWASSDVRIHAAYAKQIVAEMLTVKDGKKVWDVLSRDNHKLDATAYALAAAGCLGVRVIPKHVPRAPESPKKQERPQNTRFKKRPGGWVPRRK
jgi:phage terminase large subunit GpA-like protein